MKKLFLVFVTLFYATFLFGDYPDEVDDQLDNYYVLADQNISEEEVKEVLVGVTVLNDIVLRQLLMQNTKYLTWMDNYKQDIYDLQKIMAINKRAGNNTAYLRDEVKVKSDLILIAQGEMFQSILTALNAPNVEEFAKQLAQIEKINGEAIAKIDQTDYKSYLDAETTSTVMMALQSNIKQYLALLERNKDLVNQILQEKEMLYKLNKYARLNLLGSVNYIDDFTIVQYINKLIAPLNLDVIKIAIIFVFTFFLYLLRRVLLIAFQKLLDRVEALSLYSDQIVRKLIKPLGTLIIIINIDLVIYLYNNFGSPETVNQWFGIVYVSFSTYLFYVFVNTVATIKLRTFDPTKTGLKKDVVNVGIKILNFVIILIGILFALYFAGVDLTAVLSGLGIGGLALAFAAKDTISNFFGTISILFSDVFSQGDWISVGSQEGVVVEIGLRVTTLRTFDNALISIPNGNFASQNVTNWNKRRMGRRIKMHIGVLYSSKAEDIGKAVSNIRDMLLEHPGIATPKTEFEFSRRHSAVIVSRNDLEGVKNTLMVYLDQFSASSIDILIYCFTKTVVWEEFLQTKEDVMYKIMGILEENNLEFAYPSVSVYHENKVE